MPLSLSVPADCAGVRTEAIRLEEPAASTFGSDVSISGSGERVAVVAGGSSLVQVLERRPDGSWDAVGGSLPGRTAALSRDGTRVAVADELQATVTTYEMRGGLWERYGTALENVFGARFVSLDLDGTTLAVGHHPNDTCRICEASCSVFRLSAGRQTWRLWIDEVIGAFDFDFSVSLSNDGLTLAFSGRVYENVEGGWEVKSSFPDFISSRSVLSADGNAMAVALPDCHLFKEGGGDPIRGGCTNSGSAEVSVFEHMDEGGGWWNRRGVSVGPPVQGQAGTTSLALSKDGTTLAVAVGGGGIGGDSIVGVGGTGGATDKATWGTIWNEDTEIDSVPVPATFEWGWDERDDGDGDDALVVEDEGDEENDDDEENEDEGEEGDADNGEDQEDEGDDGDSSGRLRRRRSLRGGGRERSWRRTVPRITGWMRSTKSS